LTIVILFNRKSSIVNRKLTITMMKTVGEPPSISGAAVGGVGLACVGMEGLAFTIDD